MIRYKDIPCKSQSFDSTHVQYKMMRIKYALTFFDNKIVSEWKSILPPLTSSMPIIEEYRYKMLTSIEFYRLDSSDRDVVSTLLSFNDVARISIPDGITTIPEKMFMNCSTLHKHILNETLRIPYSVTSIESSSFKNCYNLKSIHIPHTVRNIGCEAFSHCYNLNGVIMSDDVFHIRDSAFESCFNLKKICLPKNVIYLGAFCFKNCKNLESIIIPAYVEFVRRGLCCGCTNLSEVSFAGEIGIISRKAFAYCSSMRTFQLPHGLISISADAFVGCNIKKVIGPYSRSDLNVIFVNNVKIKGKTLHQQIKDKEVEYIQEHPIDCFNRKFLLDMIYKVFNKHKVYPRFPFYSLNIEILRNYLFCSSEHDGVKYYILDDRKILKEDLLYKKCQNSVRHTHIGAA